MRIPFPNSLSIGTDIIRLSRLSKPQIFHKLAQRILQPAEQQVFHNKFPQASVDAGTPWSKQAELKCREWLGGRWAAKEAAKKAWGAALLSFRDLRIETEPDGNIVVVCALLPRGGCSHDFDEQVAKVSISHDGDYAVATVLAFPLSDGIVGELRRRKAEAEQRVTLQRPGNDADTT
jgi:holo-[acyl-carrier protein] synthase